MPKVTVLGHGTFDVEKGKKLVLALEENGVQILHRCGGHAKCTSCRVEILAGDFYDITDIEKNAFSEHGIEDFLRLSCQVRVIGEMTVRPILTVENTGKDAGPTPAE